MALAQVNRDCTSRQDKRPTVAELRGSDAIGHAADRVIFVHRDDYYDADRGPGTAGFAQIIVAKNRHGSTGTATLWFERGHFWEDRTDARLD
jgi:replicative DNA helicase